MNKAVSTVLALGLVLALTPAPPADADLIGHWSFDGNANDSSANANNAAAGGSITYQGDTPGVLGGQSARSQVGGGAGNVVTVPTSASLESINHTLSLAYWMKSNLGDNGNWMRLFQHGTEANGQQSWMVNRYSGNNEVNVRVDTTGAGGGFNQNIARGGPAVFDNTWHHVVFTLDSGVWNKYEDGAPVGSGTYNPGQGLSNTRDLYLFGRNATGEYVGFLDEVALYDAKLAPNQVQHLYAGGDPANLPAPILPPSPADITWTGAPTPVTSTADIDLTGTLVHAGNWGSGSESVALPSETILFADRPINNTGDPFASVTANGEHTSGDVYNGDTGSAAFNNVLDGFAYDGANPKVVTLLSGLTPGTDYQIQLFVSDDRGCCGGRTQKWSDDATSGAGNETAVFTHNQSVSVIGQFTATTPTQEIFGHGVNQNQNIVNAYVLRQLVDLEAHGRLSATVGGQLQGAAYATEIPSGDLYTGPTPWTLERADTLGGARTLLVSGNSAHGNQATDALFTTPAGPDLDPGFESGSLAPGWTTIADGLGGPNNQAFAAVTGGAGYAGPIGSYMLGLTNAGARDNQHELLWVRSSEFELAAGNLNFSVQGGRRGGDLPVGIPNTDFPLYDMSASSGDRYMGVALRDAATGEWLITDRRDADGNSWQAQGWTAAQLAAFVGRTVTLDVVDNYHGGWGWIGVDDFTIPFVPNPPGTIAVDPNAFYFLTVRGEEVFAGQISSGEIPEPASAFLVLLGLGALGRYGRRRRLGA